MLTPIRARPRFPWRAYAELVSVAVPFGLTVGLVASMAVLIVGWL